MSESELRHRIAVLEDALARQALQSGASVSASEDDDFTPESLSVEGFRLRWAHFMEQNAWLKSYALWEIVFVSITSESVRLLYMKIVCYSDVWCAIGRCAYGLLQYQLGRCWKTMVLIRLDLLYLQNIITEAFETLL